MIFPFRVAVRANMDRPDAAVKDAQICASAETAGNKNHTRALLTGTVTPALVGMAGLPDIGSSNC